MLEDDFTYVLRKALAGHQLAPADVAAAAGISERAVIALLRGTFDPSTARRLAPVLGLNPEAFANHTSYEPEPPSLTEITRLDLPFGPDQVNAWLVSSGKETILIDAGYERDDILRKLDPLPDRAFITHAHRDHVGALQDLKKAGVPVHAAGIPDTLAMHPGDRVCAGPLVIEARDLCGHTDPALGFLIHGLPQPVFATGDALFAGSIGGCATPRLYQTAIARLRRELAALPDATVLLPGHGPATTLSQERARNPFL